MTSAPRKRRNNPPAYYPDGSVPEGARRTVARKLRLEPAEDTALVGVAALMGLDLSRAVGALAKAELRRRMVTAGSAKVLAKGQHVRLARGPHRRVGQEGTIVRIGSEKARVEFRDGSRVLYPLADLDGLGSSQREEDQVTARKEAEPEIDGAGVDTGAPVT